jgi:hypothetical protein
MIYSLGFVMTSYREYAISKSWPIGKLFSNQLSFFWTVGFLSIVTSFVTAFFYEQWYMVLIGAVIGWLLSGAFVAIFRRHSQWIVALLWVLSFILLLF